MTVLQPAEKRKSDKKTTARRILHEGSRFLNLPEVFLDHLNVPPSRRSYGAYLVVFMVSWAVLVDPAKLYSEGEAEATQGK